MTTPRRIGADAARHEPVPRVALRWPEEAAQALGVSPDTLERHGVVSKVRLWRLGRIRLVAVTELERIVGEQSARVLEDR